MGEITTRATRGVGRWGAVRIARRLGVSAPVIGAALAIGAAAVTIRRKGLLRGTVDTALNALPVVGTAKVAVELIRGRDLLADKSGPTQGSSSNASAGLPRTRPAALGYWRRY